jgi:hypothetical protein
LNNTLVVIFLCLIFRVQRIFEVWLPYNKLHILAVYSLINWEVYVYMRNHHHSRGNHPSPRPRATTDLISVPYITLYFLEHYVNRMICDVHLIFYCGTRFWTQASYLLGTVYHLIKKLRGKIWRQDPPTPRQAPSCTDYKEWATMPALYLNNFKNKLSLSV